MPASSKKSSGRPEVTTHAEIERAAFGLFAERGFEGTTLDAIAEAVGVSRRTLFRYYSSKNDIPWGQFDRTLQDFGGILDRTPRDVALADAVHAAVLAFNSFPEDAEPSHRERMRLILHTPALQAHSVLRHAEWRSVIADFVAARTRASPADLVPQLVAQVSLALALTAYEQWLDDKRASLEELLDAGREELVAFVRSGDGMSART